MEYNEIFSSQSLCEEGLKTITGIEFTRREIEVISCLTNGRSPKKIAAFLSIAPKTIENHTRNIMLKVGCNSREGIIDFVEKSAKLEVLRKYYSNLLVQVAFEEGLKKVSLLTKKEAISCSIIYWREKETQSLSIQRLEKYLKYAGVSVKIEGRVAGQSFSQFMQEIRNEPHIICLIPHAWISDTEFSGEPKFFKNQNGLIFVLPTEENQRSSIDVFKGFNCIDLEEQKNDYFLIFAIFKRLFPNLIFEKFISDFMGQYMSTKNFAEHVSFEDSLKGKEAQNTNNLAHPVLREKKWYFISIIFIISSMGLFFSFYPHHQNLSIRSDLVLPMESVLLDRFELIAKIDENLKKSGGIQTVVLVGIGGAGKTTLARRYSQGQQANIVWEINAETSGSLRESFENLAYKLSKTEADKKTLKDFHIIKDVLKREENIISFVKERLKLYGNWFLIYNDVEKFTDIYKYFPNDANVWGSGKIIITTRNVNLQNNNHMNKIIQISELNPEEKAALFIKIMEQGGKLLTAVQIEQAKDFLNFIPPFPLDVSVAAYYLKSTNISYAAYLNYLREYKSNFILMQENILKEASEYTKSRYGIIALSLKHIMEVHKDFTDLLLFISILNAQDIPRALLNVCKNELIVDDFIYNLKKHSLLISDSLSPMHSTSTFSIHHSTQEIISSYLKKLNSENNATLIKSFAENLHKYTKENIRNRVVIKNCMKHCKKFLTHENLLTDFTKGLIEGDLAHIYFSLGYYVKANEFFEKSLSTLNKSYNENYKIIANNLIYLGKLQGILGDYTKAKNFIEQALMIYTKHTPESHGDTAWAYANLGSIHRWAGDYEKSKRFLEQSISIYKNHIPNGDTRLAWVLTQLGSAYRNLGNHKRAKELLEESLSIYKKYLPSGDTKIAQSLIYMGISEKEMGNYTKAKNLIEQGLLSFKESLPKNHIDIAWALIHLGTIHREQKNYQYAKDLTNQGLVICKSHFSENHTMVAWAFIQLANIYKELGNYEDATSLLEKALKTYEKYYGIDSIETARVWGNLGQVYFRQNSLEKAETFFQKALNLFQTSNHPERYIILENLSNIRLKQSMQTREKGKVETAQNFKAQAINYLKQALDIVNTYFPEDSPHIIRIQDKLKSLLEG